MAEAGSILHKILHQIGLAVQDGTTTKELDALASGLCNKYHVAPAFLGYRGYPASICASVNDTVVHGIPNDYKLKGGDIVGIDIGIKYRGYYADSAVTAPIGAVNAQTKKLVNAASDALKSAIDGVRPGAALGDIGFVISKVAQNNNLGVVKELSGHGIGRSLQEKPAILNYGNPKEGLTLKEGMCLAIEPMFTLGSPEIYLSKDNWSVKTKDGSPSAHFEHTVVVTKNGCKVLT